MGSGDNGADVFCGGVGYAAGEVRETAEGAADGTVYPPGAKLSKPLKTSVCSSSV